MSIQAAEITFRKIKYLERKRHISFYDGVEKYVTGSVEDKEDYYMYFDLFRELCKVSGVQVNAR